MAVKVLYPKWLYRGDVASPESVLVKDEEEEEIAKLEGYGEHPAHRKPEVSDSPKKTQTAKPKE